MRVIAWRAFYRGSRVYTSERTVWEDLPGDGVLSIVLYFDEAAPSRDPLRRIMEGSDYYFRAPGESGPIFGHSDETPESIRRRYPGASIKRGQWTDDETMHRITQQARAARKI